VAKERVKLSRINPVAKNARKFNKAKTFRDKTKYSRKDKERDQ